MIESKKVASKRRGGEQLPLALAHEASRGREDLLVSGRMEAALGMVDSWPNWPSPVVVIAGPPGSGKSHLASIWRDVSGARDITPDGGSDASATAALGPVIFEDADRVAFSETDLFHVINSVKQNGTGLLITARTWPATWPITLADLRSRLRAATLVEIGEPDEEHLAQLIFKLFSDRQLHVDEKIVDYMVPRIERAFATALEAVERIDRLALSRRSKVTRVLVAEVLSQLAAEADKGEGETDTGETVSQ